jgi:hypothetical protein
VGREISEARRMLCTNNASEKKKTGISYSPSQCMSPSHQTSGVQEFESSAAFILRKWASASVSYFVSFLIQMSLFDSPCQGLHVLLKPGRPPSDCSASLHTTSRSISESSIGVLNRHVGVISRVLLCLRQNVCHRFGLERCVSMEVHLCW